MKTPLSIASRWELFVDRFLIEELRECDLRLHPPERREVVLTTDQPEEGPESSYFTVLEDAGRFRLYYRGHCSECSADAVTCLAESDNGIQFTRPKPGLYEFAGSRANHIVHRGFESHAFAVFLDGNPDAPPAERYKALGITGVGGDMNGLYPLASPDGKNWRRLANRPVITRGAFDSLNKAFWDGVARCYRCYSRSYTEHHRQAFHGIRTIQSCTSQDFLHWTEPEPNRYPDGVPLEHFYTSATVPCSGAEHLLLAFPMRFVPERRKLRDHKEPGISDAVFMTSRDGVCWDRTFREAWLRPGSDPRNWTDRNNMVAAGIVCTGPTEFSLYASEHYRWPDNRLRRLVVGRHRFAGVHAGAEGGLLLTRPLIFTGTHVRLNACTSAAGALRVGVLDEAGRALPGLAAADMEPWFGDEFEAPISWPGDGLARLQGRPVRLQIELRDADLFALRFAD